MSRTLTEKVQDLYNGALDIKKALAEQDFDMTRYDFSQYGSLIRLIKSGQSSNVSGFKESTISVKMFNTIFDDSDSFHGITLQKCPSKYWFEIEKDVNTKYNLTIQNINYKISAMNVIDISDIKYQEPEE